jgi:DNA primase
VEAYGYKVNRNGMMRCPFHDDKNPSMKVSESTYHCFGCGAHGDAVGFVAQLHGISQYQAARQIIEEFNLPVETGRTFTDEERKAYRMACENQRRTDRVKQKFQNWVNETIEQLKKCEELIEKTKQHMTNINKSAIYLTDGFAYLMHQQPKIGYWLDILCIGAESEKQTLFLIDGKEVRRIAANVERAGNELMGRNRQCAG